jgi:hypothetical protein
MVVYFVDQEALLPRARLNLKSEVIRMSDDSVTSFSVDDVTIAQNEMRHILGLPEPRFSFPTFIGMLSDEIEQMRRAGHTNEMVAQTISRATGHSIEAIDVQRHYLPVEERGRTA